jgi:SpoVK/Ycf46/Vps4 family AAA+-type ATPase
MNWRLWLVFIVRVTFSFFLKKKIPIVQSEGFSGAEMVAVCQEAAILAMEENIQAEKVR